MSFASDDFAWKAKDKKGDDTESKIVSCGKRTVAERKKYKKGLACATGQIGGAFRMISCVSVCMSMGTKDCI
jgi:hypothetical protein